jgi:hypothetical protein
MLKTLAPFAMLSLFVACSGTSGNSVSAPAPKPEPQATPQAEPQTDTLSYSDGWKCVLFGGNGETKDVFVTRSEREGVVTLTLSDLDGEQLSPHGLELAGLRFRSFTFEAGATLSEKAVVTSAVDLPLSRIEGYLQGSIEVGFEILTQELITDRRGNLIPTPTMVLLATMEDCREARAELNWTLP